MNDPLIALSKISSLFKSWNEDKKMDSAYYAAIKVIISELRIAAADMDGRSYIFEKLLHLDQAANAMFGADKNSSDFSNNLIWANGELHSLESSSCFGS
jgi:hypothetical protein